MTLWRAAIGLFLAACIAGLARRTRSLAPDGAFAATFVGTAAVAAGWAWGAVLLTFFVSSSLLSRWKRAAKAARTETLLGKESERDARQVLANGGVFAVAAIAAAAGGWPAALPVGLAALASATSDTWATEVGTAVGGSPRSILTWRTLAAGTSGGVTLVGTLAAVAGSALIAAVVRLLGWPASLAWAVFAGGVAGSLADSLLGALAQARRWCDACDHATERRTHTCGAATRLVGGIGAVDNDLVNLLATVIGAAVGAALA